MNSNTSPLRDESQLTERRSDADEARELAIKFNLPGELTMSPSQCERLAEMVKYVRSEFPPSPLISLAEIRKSGFDSREDYMRHFRYLYGIEAEVRSLRSQEPSAAQSEFGDPRKAMDETGLQEFCISLSFEQDDYTIEVIRAVESRMLGHALFVPASAPSQDALSDPSIAADLKTFGLDFNILSKGTLGSMLFDALNAASPPSQPIASDVVAAPDALSQVPQDEFSGIARQRMQREFARTDHIVAGIARRRDETSGDPT